MERRKFVIGLGAIASGGTVVLGSGAFSAGEVDRTVSVEITDDSTGLIALNPGPNTGDIVTTESMINTNYDSADEAKGLTIDLSNGYDDVDTGINPDSTYQIGTPPAEISDAPSYWTTGDGENLLIEQEDNVYEDDHAFSVRNQSGQERDITVQFEGENFSSGTRTVGLVLIDSNGNAYADTDTSGNYRAEVTINSVEPGASVYTVLAFDVGDFENSSDIGGDITITAN